MPEPVRHPDLAVQIATLLTASRPLTGPPIETLLEPIPQHDLIIAMRDGVPGLLDDLAVDTVNVLLTLVRIGYTISHSRIVTKDVAAEWAINQLHPRYRAPLSHAMQAYFGDINTTLKDFDAEARGRAEQLIKEVISRPPA